MGSSIIPSSPHNSPNGKGAAPFQPHKHPPSLFNRQLFALLLAALFCRVGGSPYMPQKLYGEISSPQYPKPYPNDIETTTVITVPPGYRVKLVFRQFDVEPSEGCFYDFVKVGVRLGGTGENAGPREKLQICALNTLDNVPAPHPCAAL